VVLGEPLGQLGQFEALLDKPGRKGGLGGVDQAAGPAARLGGDEFAIVLEDTPESGAVEVARRILSGLEKPLRVGERDLYMSASLGIFVSTSGTETVGELRRHLLDELRTGSLDRCEELLAAMDEPFLTFGIALSMDPDMAVAARKGLDAIEEALRPWEAEYLYLNFAEERTDVRRLFDPPTYRRLQAVKERYDPGNVILASHTVAPESQNPSR
jgi:hypothetical protein